MIGDEFYEFRVAHLEPLVPEVARVSELIHLLQSVRDQSRCCGRIPVRAEDL